MEIIMLKIMTKEDIKKEATKYVNEEAPFWMRAESEDRESSIKELTDFAEKILNKEKYLNRKCYCGQPVDTTNPDCDAFNLCKEHSADS